MPIYAYRCASCGHAKDVLQKVSDAPLTECPACGAAAFAKQLTAAGFQLKGSGWYVTDFKSGNSAKKPETKTDAGDGAKTDGTKSDGAKTDGGKSETRSETKGDGGKSGDTSTAAKSGDASSSSSTSSTPKAAGCGRSCGCH